MNIRISNEALTKIVEKELTKVASSSYSEGSHLEKAVKAAIIQMAKEKVMELIKNDSNYVIVLNKMIEENIVAAFQLVAKRIAKDLGESIVSAVECEFKTYSD